MEPEHKTIQATRRTGKIILILKIIYNMQSITKAYLADIIYRMINETIDTYRASKKNQFYYDTYPTATDEEIIDFIHSIPYFDERLKDFLLGHVMEATIIISQSWEIEFIKKCKIWAESFEWLHGKDHFLNKQYINNLNNPTIFLSLPY